MTKSQDFLDDAIDSIDHYDMPYAMVVGLDENATCHKYDTGGIDQNADLLIHNLEILINRIKDSKNWENHEQE